MLRPKPALLALLLLYATLVVVVVATYSQLPDRVASHFDFNGQPDGWLSRQSCVNFTLVGAAFMAIVLGGGTYLTRYFPDSAFNLPNRDYWLAAKRRGEVYDRLHAFGLWMSALSAAMFIGLHVLTVLANRSDPVQMPTAGIGGLLAAFLIGTGFLCYLLCAPFWRVEAWD